MKKTIGIYIFIFLFSILFTGCLGYKLRTYKIEFTGKTSGRITITYENISSYHFDSTLTIAEALKTDYNELISSYLEGDMIEQEYPDAKFVSKNLYEKNNELWGEIVFEFNKLSEVYLFQYDKHSPFISSYSDDYYSSNGEVIFKDSTLIAWGNNLKILELSVLYENVGGSDTISLLNTWKQNNFDYKK